MLAEGRLSARSEPVDMKETAFYKETAGKDMKEVGGCGRHYTRALCAISALLIRFSTVV
jgi:hypothetical protein